MNSTDWVYPRVQLRRRDLLDFYTALAPYALPHLEGRPLTVVRCNGPVVRNTALRSQCEFVRHKPGANRWAPRSVPRMRIREQKKTGEYLWIDSAEALLALVDAGVIEFHVWNATVDDVEHPDRIVFDLDPGDAVEWQAVVSSAGLVRHQLAAIGLKCWPKTTGGRGIHVVVPFEPELGWSSVYDVARTIAAAVVRADPRHYTLEFARAGRGDRVLIDYKRNHRTAIAIAPFSTRARPYAPVSVPVSWRELTPRLAPEKLTVPAVEERVRRLKSDPWRSYWRSSQSLRRTIEALA